MKKEFFRRRRALLMGIDNIAVNVRCNADIEALYNGRIYPAENCVPNTEEYRRAVSQLTKCEALLRDALDEGNQPVMDSFLEAHHDVIDQTGLASFGEGLRLGARLALALLHDDMPEESPDSNE